MLSIRLAFRTNTLGHRYFSSSAHSLCPVQSSHPPLPLEFKQDMAKLLLSNRPDKFKDIAVSEHTKEQTTYGDLREKVADLATQFYIRNWQQGQVIAVFLPMGLPFYVTRLAAAQLGITLTIGTAVEFHSDMSADPTLSAYQLEKQIRDSGASYLITDVSLMPIVREVMASVRSVTELFVLNREEDIGVDKEENTKCGKGYMRYAKEVKYELILAKPPSWGKLPGWEVPLNSTMCLAYQKSTLPVGLKFTHENILAALQQLDSQEKDLCANDVCVAAIPPHDITGNIVGLDLPLLRGAQCIMASDSDVPSIVNLVKEHSATFLIITSRTFVSLVEANADLSSLKTIVISDNEITLDQATIAKVSATVKQVQHLPTTLTGKITTGGLFAPITYGPGSLLPNTEAKLVQDNQEVTVGGVLYVRGPQFVGEVTKQNSAWEKDSEGFWKTRDHKQYKLEGGQLKEGE